MHQTLFFFFVYSGWLPWVMMFGSGAGAALQDGESSKDGCLFQGITALWGFAWIGSLIGLHYDWWKIDYDHLWIPFYPEHPVVGILPETKFLLILSAGGFLLGISRYILWKCECWVIRRKLKITKFDLEMRHYGRATWKMSPTYNVFYLIWWLALIKWFCMLHSIWIILGTYPN